PYSGVYNYFLFYYLMAMRKSFIKMGEGGAQPNISKEKIVASIIPMPPFAEQKRIVAKIEELLPLIDRYEKAWSRLEEFNKRFPDDMQKSILQMAIQGKLVEQRSEEGTGEELYRQIQAEKQKLIKEGKIKKEKPLPEITEDEIPFDIPDSWKWVRLGECTSYAQTKEKVSPDAIIPEIWSLDLEDIEKDTGRIKNYCKAKSRKIIGDKVLFHKGQILYSKLRPYLRKILVAPDDGICTPELVPFNSYGEIVPDYLVAVLKSPHVDYVINSVTYGVKMPRVGTDTMVNLLIPLPPLAEQKRIVARIEELLPLCSKLTVFSM
ncbi:MAG: restriction endonuclease subunit S, partial [Clostridiales bacterium]|nr:restriction endonuclease subunit S [Clostridiales bacterium]